MELLAELWNAEVAIVLRVRHALSGTDARHPTGWPTATLLWPYACAIRRPVLTYVLSMLPGGRPTAGGR
eukprot:2442182-Rhodomonas_salina.1